ncbi:M13 family metallopeptidase [Caulobacter sp. KR2-114]|uniref:M13 family metallopeptidase n=1 Tax=Caulobacter sp. KR2-114 TaxID=3400912 RepID=UPI003C0A2EA2
MAFRTITVAAAAVALLAGCSRHDQAQPSQAQAHGLDLAGMDKSVSPGDDFFAYANGAWVKTTEIPPDRSTYGVFASLAELTDQRTADIIKAAAASDAAAGSESRKIGDYYDSYLDEAAIDARGLAPIKPRLDAIAAINDRTALARALGATVRADTDALNATNFHTENLFGLWVSPGFADAGTNAAYLMQGGLGMPDREYYLSTDPKMVAYQQAYRAHIAKVLTLAAVPDADAKAAQVYDLETRIARAHASRGDSEDVHKVAGPWPVGQFASRAPGLDWPAFFQAAGLSGAGSLVSWQPGAVKGEAALVASQPLDAWKAYLTYQALDENWSVLPKAFRDEGFAFYGKALNGSPQPRPRWKQAVDATNGALGDAVGKLYVAKWFPAKAKADAQAMVSNIVAAFSKRIDRLAWMSPQTKAKAQAKLKTLYIGVGYPEHWRGYGDLNVVKGDALGNRERAELATYHYAVGKIGRPVDKSEWWMTPQTVNAVNLPLQNALNFPAAILQPPFFDASADPALNYGGIGSTIGHEISHSFDDQGSQFDETGRLANWWTPADFAHFKASGDRLAAEFDGYEALPGLHVNGHQTLSENIADVAGLCATYDGYQVSLGGKPAPVIQGLTGDQRLFLAFAQVWRYKAREPALRRQVLTDGHAPANFRAETVRNLDAWYAAFDVKPGQRLYLAPGDRALIW